MKQSKLFIPTSKDYPKDAQIFSHKHLIRSGFVTQNGSGLYTYLPMALKILKNIEQIISEEIDAIGGNEVRLPFLQNESLWSESGRWQSYGPELFRVQDRHQNQFALAPTHEEIVTDVVRTYLTSYKMLPLNLYQTQTKMRDEIRPRFGLLRAREFIMFDGYSFHETPECLAKTYDDYYQAYGKILNRIGINFKTVKADNGSMGGSQSHEFMALAEIGEDTICYEEGIEEAYNVEVAPIFTQYQMQVASGAPVEKVLTEDQKTISQVSAELNVSTSNVLKSVAYDIDGQIVIAFTAGNREVQETKLLRLIGGESIEPASNNQLTDLGIVPGFIGPFGLTEDVRIVFDLEAKYMADFVCGANEHNYHLKNANLENIDDLEFADIRTIEAGDLMRENGNPVKLAEGIEVGHIFALGDRYSKSLNVNFLNKDQKSAIPLMGCYGIGVSRLLSAYIEQNNVNETIVYNEEIAPFTVHLIPLDYNKNPEQKAFTDELEAAIKKLGHTVLVDDRDQRPGSKFVDSDLIGIPNQVVIGRDFQNGEVEFKIDGNRQKITIEKLLEELGA